MGKKERCFPFSRRLAYSTAQWKILGTFLTSGNGYWGRHEQLKAELGFKFHTLFPMLCWFDGNLCTHIFNPYLIDFSERGKEGEKKGGRETSVGCFLYMTQLGPNPQPRQVSWPGIEPVNFWFIGWCSKQLSHISQCCTHFLKLHNLFLILLHSLKLA